MIQIKLPDGFSQNAQENIVMLIVASLTFLAQPESYAPFNSWCIQVSHESPANIAMAKWFQNLSRAMFAHVMNDIQQGIKVIG